MTPMAEPLVDWWLGKVCPERYLPPVYVAVPPRGQRARAKLNQIAARKTRPPKQKTQPLAQLRAW
ncbi:hypothetical protein [Streptomyces eurythermus]|uniref:hypothetical protein n=1 Tax=Streptomyces eurythermus TaxID=42237 RepID=UPI0036F759E8